MGSDSDLDVMQGTLEVLSKFNLPFEVKISSAHRTPADTHAYVADADARGCAVFIAAAGMAAHLAGTVAGLTTKPVIGVPIDAGPLQGMDSLLSTVQMPAGIPVATVAIGKAGAKERRSSGSADHGLERRFTTRFYRCGTRGKRGVGAGQGRRPADQARSVARIPRQDTEDDM